MHPQSSNNGAQMAGSVDATLTELRDMAMRQQHQIEMQQQILVAKEQRLKYLRQHEQRQLAVATENERLRRLREKVEAQELKLKKLRAMKGQVDNHKQHNNALNSELESVRALFNEKEKELSIAVAKVEQLSGQLEKLREGRIASLRNNRQDSPAMIELERLRQELLMRNKLNEQQNSKLIEQRHLLAQRKEQIGEMDARIQQLQDRLKKKRQLQQVHNDNILNKQKPNRVAAVEPYIKHVAKQSSEDLKPSVKTTAQNESKYKTLPTNQKNVADNILDESARSNVPNKEGLKSNNDIPKSSVGHSTAYKVMEDTLNSSDLVSKPSSSSVALPSAVPSSTTSGVQRPGFGGYRAPNSLSNFTPRPFGSTYSTASSGNRPYVSGAPPPSLSTSDMFPKTSTPISSAAQSPAMGTDVAGVSDSHEIFITDGPTSGKPMSDINSQSQQKPASTPASSTASSTIESSPNTSQDQIDNAGFRMLTSKHRYASKDVIADTYTNPINQRSIQEYQKHISDIYKSSSSDAHTSTHGTGAPAQETSRLDPPAYPGAPPYNIDPMRYKPNPTRNVRRRPSMDNRESELYAGSTGYQRPVVQSDKQQVAETTSSPTPAIQKENSSATIWSPGTAGSPQSNHTTVATNNWNHTLNQNSAVSGTNTADKMQPLQESTEGEVKSPKLPPVPLPKRIKGIVKTAGSRKHNRRVSFDPLALLLDASLEGELDLVIRTSSEVPDPSAANDEGITALHNAICAGHYDIVRYLIEFGCNVNSPDSDGWTPLHCAASCNNLPMVRFLVEHGACIFATTISDHETAAVKCEEEEEGFVGCTEYLYGIQEQLGVSNKSIVYAVFDYDAQNPDELSFKNGDAIEILRKGDEQEQEWWWGKIGTMEGYVPKNLLGLHARVEPKFRYPSTK